MVRRKRFAIAWLALGLCALGGYLWTAQHTPGRFSVRASGQEVHDRSSGLTWRRCTEGMRWSGVGCTGEPRTFTQIEATEHAAQQTGWRLPTVGELHTLVDAGRRNPAIDTQAFPDTPPDWFWSASQANSRITHAWLVHFGEGRANMALRLNHMPARLVRR
jgi:hypothetical protein